MLKIYSISIGALVFLVTATTAFADRKPVTNPASGTKEILVDAIVASVDGKPITLHDLSKRLSPPRNLTLKEASLDPEANAALDSLIMENLVLQEAEIKRITVGTEEINQYVEEVAKRNNLSREGFEQALKQEGRDIAEYKNFVKIDILKSRLASSLMQSGVGISNEEIDEYIKEHPELSGSGTKLKLAHLVVSEDKHGEDGAKKVLQEVSGKLEGGEEFSEVVRAYSDSPDATEGGSLGIIAQKDLSSDIFEAVSELKPGEYSKPIQTAQGYQIFQVIEQFKEDADEEVQEKMKDEVRKTLQRQKLAEKMNSFFTAELMKNHAVDRKI